jgi:hypothetical protein
LEKKWVFCEVEKKLKIKNKKENKRYFAGTTAARP